MSWPWAELMWPWLGGWGGGGGVGVLGPVVAAPQGRLHVLTCI